MTTIYSEELEKAVLYSLWNNWIYAKHSDKIKEMLELHIRTIPEKLFGSLPNQHLLKGMKSIFPNFDSITLQVWLKKNYPNTAISSSTPFIETNVESSVLDLPNHVTYLKQLAFRRIAVDSSISIKQDAENDNTAGILANAKRITKAFEILTRNGNPNDVFQSVIAAPIGFIKTGFTSLTKLIGGYSRKEVSSLGGKSGHHKTNFVIADAVQRIKQDPLHKVHIVSVEHPASIIVTRLLSNELGISFRDIIENRTIFNKQDAYNHLKLTYGGRIFITDSALKLSAVNDCMRATKVDQHIIDHAQEIEYPNNDMLGGISQLLLESKGVAREQNSNVLILSQVKDKEINNRVGDKVPKSHDFYNSSRIKQESRQLLVGYWKFKDAEEGILEFPDSELLPQDIINDYRIICYKSSYTGTGKINLTVLPANGRFSETP